MGGVRHTWRNVITLLPPSSQAKTTRARLAVKPAILGKVLRMVLMDLEVSQR